MSRRGCALEKGKPVLCEKAFTANAEQAETLIRLSKEKQVFLTEAIWTRYMPFSETLRELVDGGTIGRVMMLTANIGYPIAEKERIAKPELCGGALLDIGVYPINFARMLFGSEITGITSACVKGETGVDLQSSITFCVSESSDGCFTNDRFLCERSPGELFRGIKDI